MGCDKTRLREIDALECPLCYEQVEQCDECLDGPTVNEDWWCYNDGQKHYCDNCWQEHLTNKGLNIRIPRKGSL